MRQKLFIVLSLCMISHVLNAQDTTKHQNAGKIGITFSSLGDNGVYQTNKLMGGPSYLGDGFYTFGFNYLIPIRKWLAFETGVEYARHTLLIESFVFPASDNTSRREHFSIISIPLTVRVNFLKYFFVNGGFSIDMAGSSSISDQTGIGGHLGIGVSYDFTKCLSVFVNPYVKPHALLAFSSKENGQHIIEDGFRFGVMYTLK